MMFGRRVTRRNGNNIANAFVRPSSPENDQFAFFGVDLVVFARVVA